MLASKVLITAGTPGHMYLEERQAKCLKGKIDKQKSAELWLQTGFKLWFCHLKMRNHCIGLESRQCDSRHGLVDGLNAVAHGKLVGNLLRHVVIVDLPAVVSTGFGDPDRALTQNVSGVVE